MRWVRFQLSDGSFVRLVETVAAPGREPAHQAPPSEASMSQSAIAAIDSHWR